ncbi:MAG: sulfotransferase [Candidatus Desulfacyla sp.]
MPSQKVVIVLGMSRSGTSLLAKGINVLGVELGHNLLPPTAANPKGHWENVDIFDINERLLNMIGSSWHSLALTGEIDFSSHCFDPVKSAARAVIENLASRYPIWGFKDPRACRLLPFWQEILNEYAVDIHYIVCLRSPIDVALSLKRRNHFGKRKSLLLWLAHVYWMAKFIDNDRSIIVQYEELMNRAHAQLNRIADFLNIDISDKQKAIDEYCNSFLDTDLCHHSSSLNPLRSAPDFQQIIFCYDRLVSLASKAFVTRKEWLELYGHLNCIELVWAFFQEVPEGEIRRLKATALSRCSLSIEQTHPLSNGLDRVQNAPESLVLFVDYPERTHPVSVFRKLAVSGWALSLSGIAQVQVLQPDGRLVHLDYGLPRKDVQKLHPAYPYADSSGFSGCLNLSRLGPGSYELCVRVTSRSGEVKESRIPFIKM